MDKSGVTLERLRTFVRVAERSNLSAVARDLNVGQSSVTRHLRELEEALGVALLSRTTRRVTLTAEGSRYYESAVHILRAVEQAGDEARSARDDAVGMVRLSCTAALGVRHVIRLIFGFQDLHPGITVDLGLTDDRVDLVREGVDIALRLGPLSDSAMRLRSLGQSRRVLVASPEYLIRHGRPAKPEALMGLEGVRMSNVAGSDELPLATRDGQRHVVAFGGRLLVDHGLAAREAFVAGRGFGPAHIWLVDDLVAEGRLEVILPDYAPPPVPLNMLIAPARTSIARIRLLVDYLAEQMPTIPGVERA